MIKKIITAFACVGSFVSSFAAISSQEEVKAVVFDFGGVVAKPDKARILQFLTNTFQMTEKELRPTLNRWKIVLANNDDEKKFWKEYANSLGKMLPQDWFEEFEKVTAFVDIPGTLEIVKNLQSQGYQTPMLSNIQKYEASMVERFDYYKLFEPVLLSCEMGVEKPQQEAFQILLDRLHLPASAVVFVDDQKENVEAAGKLGIDSILFTTAEKLKEELEKRKINVLKEAVVENYTIVEKPSMTAGFEVYGESFAEDSPKEVKVYIAVEK